jgi:hypothetical protein
MGCTIITVISTQKATSSRDDEFTGNADFNFNAFNTDLIFAWQFAPGSFLNIVYKNDLQRDEQDIELSYFNNLRLCT